MRNFTLGLLFMLLGASMFAQTSDMEFAEQKLEERGEFYFTFTYQSKEQVFELSQFLSIDDIKGTTVYAYANNVTFELFKEYHIQFTPVYEYYNTSKALTMATTTAQMASWDRYPTHAVYLEMLDDFVANYPSLCKLETIGTSENGVPIKCLIISDNINTDEDEPEFWWSGTMHGDELAGYIMQLRFADYLLSNYGSISQVTNMVNNIEIYINPLSNPDGTFAGSPSLVSVSSATRANGNGTDLNRNFPEISGSATTIDSEIQCMMDYSDLHDFVMSANTHGGIELMNYPWDNWTSAENIHPDDNWWQLVCWKYATPAQTNSPSGYFTGEGGVTEGADWYYAYGTRQDYFTYFKNIREVTIELSDVKQLDVSQLNDHWDYNRQAMLDYTEQVLYGFRGIVTNACTGAALEDVKVEIVGHDQDNTEIYSSAPVGDYHRPIYTGTYDVTFSLTGYQSKTVSVTVVNDASTRLDIELIPDGTGSPDFTATPTSIFEGQTVNFTDASTGTITSRDWIFESGSPASSTATNPTNISYATAGTYDVTLEIVSGGCTVSELKTDYITVAAAVPVVSDFVADATIVSQGTTVNFSDLSTSNPDSWTWTFAGGTPTSSTDQNPSVVYGTPGTYTVTLNATNAYGGNTETKTDYIIVTEADILMADGSITACSGLFKDDAGDSNYSDQGDLTFTIYPSTAGAFVRLTFTELNLEENGTTDCYDYITIYDGENTSVTEIGTYCHNDYTAVGTGGVVTSTDLSGALTIYFSSDNNVNESGWVAEISCYSPTDPPVADFTSNVTSTCTGEIDFSDQSTLPTSWLWNFGDGTSTSSVANPEHTYTTNGTYTVQLTVTNAYGTDSHSITDMITVDMPVAPLTTGAQSCGAASLTLNASGSGTLAWYDALTGGTEITTGASYTNTFSSTSTLYVQSEIDNTTTDTGGAADNSGNGGYYTNATQHGLIFDSYQPFTLTTVKVYAETAGDRTIELTDASDAVIESITVNIPIGESVVTLDFEVPVGTGLKLMGPASPNLYRNSNGTSYPYDIVGILSINDNTADNLDYYYYFYDWQVVTGDFCISSRTPVVATIDDAPSVELGAPVTQCGGTVDLDAGTGMTSYTWNGTLGAQTYTATTTNTYTVVVENTAGCTATDNVDVTINSAPATVVVSGGGTQCGGSMTLTATNGGEGTIYWQNTTSDGISTATASASQAVSASGTYYFRALSAEGCWGDEGSASVTINDIPATVVVSGGGTQCGGSMTLTATNGGEGTIYWQNTTSNGISTASLSSSETVAVDGIYYFRAQSAEGCWGNEGSASVTINDIPATVVVSGGGTQCGGSMTLTATNGGEGTIYWQNTTSDGTSIATASTSEAVSTSGTYYFRAQSAEGCWGDEGSTTVTIDDLPADVIVTGGGSQCGGSMTLTATNGGDGTIYWQNTISDGTSTAITSASQIISADGTYFFRAQSAEGCWSNEGSASVTINDIPAAVVVSGGGTQCGGSMTLTATNGGNGTIYFQNTTSGGTSTAIASSFETISVDGTYYFRAQSTEGCWGDQGSAVIVVEDNILPTASNPPAVNVECFADVSAVDIQAVTDEADNCTLAPLVAHVSDVSDGNLCPETITRTYSVTDETGNNITVTQTIIISDVDNPTASNLPDVNVASLGDVPVPNIADVTDEADNCSANPVVTFVSDVSDGNACPEVITRTYSVSDDCGNSIFVTQIITINSTPTAVMVTGGGTQCGGSMTLTATNGGEGIIYWQNTISGGTSTATVSAAEIVSASGTYYFRALSAEGCWGDEGSVSVTINDIPAAVVVSGGGTQCGGSMTLTATNGGDGTIYWQNTISDGTSTASLSSSETVSVDGTYYFRAQSAEGCWSNEGSASVTIYPTFTVSTSSTDETSAGANDGTVTVDMIGGSSDFNGVWSYGAPTNTSGTSMMQSGLTGGYYSVTVTDDNGCTATGGATVNTSGSAPVAAFEADIVHGCDNLNVQFTDLSNNSPTSWSWDFGDGNTSTLQNPIHTYTTPGQYSVILTVDNAFGSNNHEIEEYIAFGETPVLVMSMTDETVAGNDGTATVEITGGELPYSIVWSNSADTETITGLGAGEYCVTVTETYGCLSTDCITVVGVVLNPPVADFSTDETEGCGSVDVQFTDLSSNNPTDWSWDFGDGNTSTDQNPMHTYDVVGIYTVSLIAMNADGDGVKTLADYIEVFSQPSLSFAVTQESGTGMANGEIDMTIIGGTEPYIINWSNDMHDEDITGLTAGVYSVAVVDGNGCMATGMAEVTVATLLVDGQKLQISVYPNPNNGQFSITADENIDNVLIFDSLGRLVFDKDVNSNIVSIESSLKPGMYHVRIVCSDNTYDSKIIIK